MSTLFIVGMIGLMIGLACYADRKLMKLAEAYSCDKEDTEC